MKGGDSMKYTAKWIEDHLGISSDTIRYYEKIDLRKCPRNPQNEYREYTEDYLISLWTIKLLCGIGYSLEEIGKIKSNRQFDFSSYRLVC